MKITAMIHQDAENVQPTATTFEQSITEALADLELQQRQSDARKFAQAKCNRFELWPANTKECVSQIASAVPLYTVDAGDFIDWVSDIATPLVETVAVEQRRVMDEKFEQWRRGRTETYEMAIKSVLGKCHRMGVADGTLADIVNHAQGTVWTWISRGEVRTKEESRRKDGRSITKGVSICDIVECSCTTPDCRCPCTCGKKDVKLGKRCATEQCKCPVVDGIKSHRKTGKGCQCQHSIKKWISKLAFARAEEWKYEHEAKSNPTSLDAMTHALLADWNGPHAGSSGSFIDLDGIDSMARDDYEAAQAETYLEEHGELPSAPIAEPDLDDVLRAEDRPLKTESHFGNVKPKVFKQMWTAAPSLMVGKRAALFMQYHAENPTDESRAALEGWRNKFAAHNDLNQNPPVGAIPVRRVSQAQWKTWMDNQGVFTGDEGDLSGYVPSDTLADLQADRLPTALELVGPAQWTQHPVYGRVKLFRKLANGRQAWVTVKKVPVLVEIADLTTEKPKKKKKMSA